MSHTKPVARKRRHFRVRKKVRGTAARPRLAVFRSNKHIYAQVIDDVAGRTVAVRVDDGVTDVADGSAGTVAAAKAVGERLGERAKSRRHRHRSSSTAAGSSTTAASRRSPTVPAAGPRVLAAQERSSWPKASTKSGSSRSTGSPRWSRVVGGSPSPPSSSWVTATATSASGYGKAKEVPAAIQKGMEEAKKNTFAVAAGRLDHHPPDPRRPRRGPRAPQAGCARYRCDRRRRGACHPRGGRRARRARQVARLVERDQRVARDDRRPRQGLRRPDDVAKMRGKSPEEVSTVGMLKAYRERNTKKTEDHRGRVMRSVEGHPGASRRSASSRSSAARSARSGCARIGTTRRARGHAGDPRHAGQGAAPRLGRGR